MLLPSRNFGFNSLFDDFFDKDFFRMPKAESSLMQTDVRESDGGYLLEMNLPGYKKEDIHAELKDGYLTIKAEHKEENDKKDENGNYVFRERYSGSCQRRFYVGEDISQEDIKASFEDGTLKLSVPKKEVRKIEEKPSYIAIE